MPLYSTQQYIRGLLDGLPAPGGSGQRLKAQITPPALQNLKDPVAFVWGSSMRAERQAGPRGTPGHAGFKKLSWEIGVSLWYLTNPTSTGSAAVFPQLVDAVMAAVWLSPITLFVDANGNVTQPQQQPPGPGQLLNVGENFRLEYEPVHTPETQRMLLYSARLTFDVDELVQA